MVIILAQRAQQAQPPARPAQEPKAEYCTGLSINADFFWPAGTDVRFLTAGGKEALVGAIQEAAAAGRMKVVDTRVSLYGPNPEFGFSYLVVLGQSHIMIHTWPEKFFMNVDIFTCGSEGDPALIFQFLQQRFSPEHVQKNQVQRGVRKDIASAQEKPDSPASIAPPGTQKAQGEGMPPSPQAQAPVGGG